MQQTRKLILETFIDELNQEPLNKITVTALCKECKINRNTFYYYFDDIYGVLTEIFEEHVKQVVLEMDETESFEESFSKAISFVLNNKKLVNHVYYSLKKDELESYLYRISSEVVKRYITNQASMMEVRKDDMDLLCNFYSCALTEMIMRWIQTGLNVDAEADLRRLAYLLDGNLRRSLLRSKNN